MYALSVDRAHFCGLNGGPIAVFALAKTDPGRIRSIVCTCIGMDNPISPFKFWLGRNFPGNPSARLIGRLVVWLMLTRAPDGFVVAHLWSKNTSPMATMINGVFPLYEHYDPPVERLTMPVLNIQSSPVVSEGSAKRFVELLPRGELKTIKGLSHLCMWTKADEFNSLVEDFYRGPSRREERLNGRQRYRSRPRTAGDFLGAAGFYGTLSNPVSSFTMCVRPFFKDGPLMRYSTCEDVNL
jgi:pimeloyl-ACP methyl ester carboxylesterase